MRNQWNDKSGTVFGLPRLVVLLAAIFVAPFLGLAAYQLLYLLLR